MSTATGLALIEYDDPDPDTPIAARKIEKCIQAETDEEFYISVRMGKGFHFRGGRGIMVAYHLDGDTLKRKTYRKRASRYQIVKDDEAYTIDHTMVNTGGIWKRI